jgi:sugar phosphate permease
MKQKENHHYGYSPSDYKKFKRFAWMMLLSFGLTYLFFYNGRQNINLVMTQMAEELGSTTAAMGVVSSALFWCYAFGQLVNGRLGALIGYKRFMMMGVIASAILNVVISFQHSVPVIAVLWGLNGFFQSTVWSNGLGVLNKWWPKRERGFASGLTTAFSGVAQVVTYLTILLCMELNPEWGWRAGFRYPMIPMVLMVLLAVTAFILSRLNKKMPEIEAKIAADAAAEAE